MSATAPVWKSMHAPAGASGVFEELTRLGAVYEMGPGAVATGPLFSDLLDALDTRIRDLATGRFGARQYRYPTLISTSGLTKGGYLGSFPQFVMSAGRLHSDLDVYRQFVEGIAGGEAPGGLLEQHGEHSGYCLPPTMCFHTYLQLSGTTLTADATVVTSRGKSFRYESRYSRSLERLWDFTIREIVFLGDAETVVSLREDFLTATCELVEELGLAGHVEPANDPFFADAAAPRRILAQRLRKLKYELRLPAEEGRDLAAASFNIHGTTFGEPYELTLPNREFAHTACVGFGLERLAFAFFCQHGTRREQWPARLRASLGV
jgi:seryl-tRNA synthetase